VITHYAHRSCLLNSFAAGHYNCSECAQPITEIYDSEEQEGSNEESELNRRLREYRELQVLVHEVQVEDDQINAPRQSLCPKLSQCCLAILFVGGFVLGFTAGDENMPDFSSYNSTSNYYYNFLP
jgi:hypothetical protein